MYLDWKCVLGGSTLLSLCCLGNTDVTKIEWPVSWPFPVLPHGGSSYLVQRITLFKVDKLHPLVECLDSLTRLQTQVRVGSVVLDSQPQKHLLFILLFKLLSLFLNLKILHLLDFLLGLFKCLFFLNCDNVFIIHFCSLLVMNLILLLSPSISSVQFCQV